MLEHDPSCWTPSHDQIRLFSHSLPGQVQHYATAAQNVRLTNTGDSYVLHACHVLINPKIIFTYSVQYITDEEVYVIG